MKIDYIEGSDLEKRGLNLLYSVGKGSANIPNMVTLSYLGNPDKKEGPKSRGLMGYIGK